MQQVEFENLLINCTVYLNIYCYLGASKSDPILIIH